MEAEQLDRDVSLLGLSPAFDPKTKSWFITLDTIEYEASTMRQLRATLRRTFPTRRISFIGYFPQGRHVTPLERGSSITADRIIADRRAHEMASEARQREPKREKINHREATKTEVVVRERHHDHEAILDLWAKGVLGKDIAVHTGAQIETVYGVVTKARENGDPRAVKRYRGYVTAASSHHDRDHIGATSSEEGEGYGNTGNG